MNDLLKAIASFSLTFYLNLITRFSCILCLFIVTIHLFFCCNISCLPCPCNILTLNSGFNIFSAMGFTTRHSCVVVPSILITVVFLVLCIYLGLSSCRYYLMTKIPKNSKRFAVAFFQASGLAFVGTERKCVGVGWEWDFPFLVFYYLKHFVLHVVWKVLYKVWLCWWRVLSWMLLLLHQVLWFVWFLINISVHSCK